MYRCTVSIVGVVRLLYGQPTNSNSIPYTAKNSNHHRTSTSQQWRNHKTFSMFIAGFLFSDKAAGAWSWWHNLIYCSVWECSELYFKAPTLFHGLLREHITWMLLYCFITCDGYVPENSAVSNSCLTNIENFKGRSNISSPRQFFCHQNLC